MNKIVGIDVDDTIAKLVSRWLQYYNFDHNDVLQESDIKDWNIGDYTKIGSKMYDYLKLPNLYDDILPEKNSFFGVSTLRNMGYRVIFVTASTPEQTNAKYIWLQKHGLITKREDYFEALDKSLIACDYLVDDRPENVIKAYGKGVIYTKEWNKYLTGYPRVNNWIEVVDFFSKQKNGQEIISV
jgi:5'(3')-deoxyribonucleotidase